MAGTFPNLCLGQQIDANGRPLAGAVLTVYNGGTLQLASVYQDFGLTNPAPNPMKADLTGRLPAFFVNDSTYRCILVDATGVSILDVTLPSIGPSGGGGGGGAVDPTTIFQTGDELWRKIGGTRTGWVRQNALTIGSATSGASERANADCQNLFLYLWNNYPNSKCPVVGGRGGSAASDWAANKQITLPDMRGRGPFGKDGMGNSRANLIPDGNVSSGGGDGGDTDAAFGGQANQMTSTALAQANLPNVTFNVSGIALNNGPLAITTNIATNTNGSNTGIAVGGVVAVNQNWNSAPFNFSGASDVTVSSQGVASSGGSGTPANSASFAVMPPFSLGTWYLKL